MSKVLLSFFTGLAVASYTVYNIRNGVLPWGPKVIEMCLNSANNDVEGNLRVVYTGLTSILDRVICIYVNFNQQGLHDIVGAPLTRLLMCAFGTVYAIMAFEGSRKGYKNSTLMIAYPLLGLLSELIGIALVFPALWIPLDFYYKKTKVFTPEELSLTQPEVYGILFALLFGYGVPSAIVSSPLVKNDSAFEQDLLCVWIVLPIILVPVFSVLEKLFKYVGTPVDSIREPALRKRLYIAEGKDALERAYLFLGVINMLLYYGMYLLLAHQGIHVWDSLLLLLNAPGNLPAGLTFGDLGQLLGTRTVLIEYLSLGVSFVLWAIFSSDVKAGLIVAIALPIVGPGAAVSFYACYRENTIQDISDPEETEKLLASVNTIKTS